MDSKWRLCTSHIKSIIRIASCTIGLVIGDITTKIICGGLCMAEILGILEEIKDER